MRQIIRLTLFFLAASPLLIAADYRFVKIHVPNSISTDARGINARGDIVGSYIDADDVSHGFLLHKGVFTTIDVPNAAATLGARGINARGDIVGTFVDAASVQHGYLLCDGTFTRVDYPGASATNAFGIDNAGDITGSHVDASGNESGFVLKNGVFFDVHIRGTLTTGVFSVQDNGRVMVGQVRLRSDGGFYGFVRTKPGDSELILFPGSTIPCTGARWISQRGDIVGFFAHVNNIEDCGHHPAHGFILRRSQYRRITFPEAADTRVLAINDDGVIVGNFTDRRGNTHGFKAVPRD